MNIKIPAFGETAYTDHNTNKTNRVVNFTDAKAAAFADYCRYLREAGFTQKEAYTQNGHSYAAFQKDDRGVFLNYFAGIRELNIVSEENCRYFNYTDVPGKFCVSPQITQVHLHDFGMSYAIRLSDGRFIVIDGGWEFDADEDRLLQCLEAGAPGQTPVIAAWILTHPHIDHYRCFMGFMERYGDRVRLEKVLLNFPEADDLVHYPKLDMEEKRKQDSETIQLPRLFQMLENRGLPVYIPHTGQVYRIGDAVCKFLATMDDTIHLSNNINMTSLMFRMELAGQVILWTADGAFSAARLLQKFGDYLQADILQVPHHGFQCGTADAEIAAYDVIRPKVCLLPEGNRNAFTDFCIYRDGTRHLMTNVGVQEFITGSVQRTITLPYTASTYGRQELECNVRQGLDNGGARTWVFMELDTGREADLTFTVLNATMLPATVTAQLLFEERAQRITNVTFKAPRNSIRRFCLLAKGESQEDETFIDASQLPENAPFAVRFISDQPVVISHRDHAPAYHSSYNG